MSDTKRTPLPWSRSDYREDIVDSDGELLATTYSMDDGGDDAAAANAAFIVRAVNSHEQLVSALRASNEAILSACSNLTGWGDVAEIVASRLREVLAENEAKLAA